MNPTQHKFYTDFLKNGEVTASKVPSTILKSATFIQLMNGRIIADEKAGKGRKYLIANKDKFTSWLSTQTNSLEGPVTNKSEAIQKFKDSKASKTEQVPFYFIRGFQPIKLKQKEIDLPFFTTTFGAFLTNSLEFTSKNICVVENKESFLKAEKLLGESYLFIHKYGRWNTNDFSAITCDSLLVFSDYDLIGLDEFLKIKSVIPTAQFYYPENYQELFQKFAVNKKETINQIQSDKVKSSTLFPVVEIRDSVLKNNKFLEQEALFLGL
ncbi:MAG: hypothetical protein ACOVNZ_05620 [Crocinitomicaceae bacterium]